MSENLPIHFLTGLSIAALSDPQKQINRHDTLQKRSGSYRQHLHWFKRRSDLQPNDQADSNDNIASRSGQRDPQLLQRIGWNSLETCDATYGKQDNIA
jgi:hypothetical protein